MIPFWCPFWDPHLTTHYSNIDVRLRWVHLEDINKSPNSKYNQSIAETESCDMHQTNIYHFCPHQQNTEEQIQIKLQGWWTVVCVPWVSCASTRFFAKALRCFSNNIAPLLLCTCVSSTPTVSSPRTLRNDPRKIRTRGVNYKSERWKQNVVIRSHTYTTWSTPSVNSFLNKIR